MNLRECASPFCDEEFLPRTHNQKYHTAQCKRDAENVARRQIATYGTATLEREAFTIKEAQTLAVELTADTSVEEQLDHLRTVNRTLARENAKLKAAKYEIASFVKEAVIENIKDLNLAPVKKSTPASKSKGTPEVAIAQLSDWQIGKLTESYNVDACEEAIEQFADKQIRITEMQRSDHPVNDARIWLLGDMVEGEGIFPGQAHHLDKSLYYQVVVDGPRIIVNYLRRMLGVYDRLHVVGIAGNHGRIGGRSYHEMNPETNADRMLYAICRNMLEHEKRITWDIPLESLEGDFYTIDTVGEKKHLLLHGHQFRSISGVEKRMMGWATGGIRDHFDYAHLGHLHTPTRLTVNRMTVWVNGSPETDNGYASEVMGASGRPCQYLFFSHPQHGITSEHCIYLER